MRPKQTEKAQNKRTILAFCKRTSHTFLSAKWLFLGSSGVDGTDIASVQASDSYKYLPIFRSQKHQASHPFPHFGHDIWCKTRFPEKWHSVDVTSDVL